MPMNRALYPDNWEEIALAINQAANWQCQECARPCRRFGDEADICYWDANDLELVQDVLGVEISPKGCWIESITAKRKRKSGRVVQYEYFHLVTWDAQTKRERRRHLGSATNPRYLEMKAAIARRDRLGKEATNG